MGHNFPAVTKTSARCKRGRETDETDETDDETTKKKGEKIDRFAKMQNATSVQRNATQM